MRALGVLDEVLDDSIRCDPLSCTDSCLCLSISRQLLIP